MEHCKIHKETKLICPRCIAAKGGKARALSRTQKEIKRWGKKGGKVAAIKRKKAQ